MAVILQPDGSLAFLPAWMLDESAARFSIDESPTTGPALRGKAWTEQSVRGFRKHHDVAAYRDGELAERGEITLDAAAEMIGVCKMTALRRELDIKWDTAQRIKRTLTKAMEDDDGNLRLDGLIRLEAHRETVQR